MNISRQQKPPNSRRNITGFACCQVGVILVDLVRRWQEDPQNSKLNSALLLFGVGGVIMSAIAIRRRRAIDGKWVAASTQAGQGYPIIRRLFRWKSELFFFMPAAIAFISVILVDWKMIGSRGIVIGPVALVPVVLAILGRR